MYHCTNTDVSEDIYVVLSHLRVPYLPSYIHSSPSLHRHDHARSRGIIHRDLKPENLLLTDMGPSAVVKVSLVLQVGRDCTSVHVTFVQVGSTVLVTVVPCLLVGINFKTVEVGRCLRLRRSATGSCQ